MPQEIEVKLRVNDPAALDARLAELTSEPPLELFEINTYFDTPEGVLRDSNQGLRLRVERRGLPSDPNCHTVNIITHKGPRLPGAVKSRVETEIEVDDAAAARDLINALGYIDALTFQKRRRRYEVEDCHVEVDTLPVIGRFVEVEGPTEDSVLRVRDLLGLRNEPLVQNSYVTMLADHIATHGDADVDLTIAAE